MSKLSDKLAEFFGKLFPMSRNKTIKLNNEIRQTENIHFVQLCEMLEVLEKSINEFTAVCKSNSEQIKQCREMLRIFADEQTSFSEDTSDKFAALRLSIEKLEKENSSFFEKLSAQSVELSDRISASVAENPKQYRVRWLTAASFLLRKAAVSQVLLKTVFPIETNSMKY